MAVNLREIGFMHAFHAQDRSREKLADGPPSLML